MKNKLGKKPFGYIYTITNKKTKKVYVGASMHLNKRWQWHKYIALSNLKRIACYRRKLHFDIRIYGVEKFEYNIVGKAGSKKELKELELKWIVKLDATNPKKGYNKVLVGWSVTDNQRKMTSISTRDNNIGKKHSKATNKRIGKYFKGKPKTDEHKKKMSIAWKKWYDKRREFARHSKIRIPRINYGTL